MINTEKSTLNIVIKGGPFAEITSKKKEIEEEDFFPHSHDFSALNQIKPQEPTADEIEAKKKEQELLKGISKYEMLFSGMERLMYQAALDGEDLDEAYEKLKNWTAFM
jgi:hypothetical protein